MKLLLIGAATAIAVGAATPVLAAQADDPSPSGTPSSHATGKPAKPDKANDKTDDQPGAKASGPGPEASQQGRESSARGRAHRDAMHAWQKCVLQKGKAACEKPAPPGLAKGHGKQHGKAHAPGQLKPKAPESDDADD